MHDDLEYVIIINIFACMLDTNIYEYADVQEYKYAGVHEYEYETYTNTN